MFWRFGFHNPSAIDTLLDREDIELEDILEEEDLLQEAKSHNQKLVDFLCKPENLTKLLNYITATDLEEPGRYKYPFLSCEIIACEIPQIVDAIILDNKDMLESFWKFLDRPAPPRRRINEPITAAASKSSDDDNIGLDPIQAQYFCKTISVFLTKRTSEVLDFIKSKPEHLDQILAHLQTSAIMDLLLTLVRVEELSEGKGIVQWLSDHGLLDNLVERLDPYLDSEEHSIAQQCICEIIRMSQTSLVESPSIGMNDLIVNLKSEKVIRKLAGYMLDNNAPNATSTLINGVTIIIDLIRHNNSDMDNDPILNGAYGYPTNTTIRQNTVSLADMLRVLADHVGDFNNLLIKPRSVTTPMRTTLGEQMPLGFERLKICELFAELLHCSNMSNLNIPAPEESAPPGVEENEKKDPKEPEMQPATEAVSKDTDGSSDADVVRDDQPNGTVSAHSLSGKQSEDHLLKETDVDASGSPEGEHNGSKQTETVFVERGDGSKVSIGDYLKIQFVEHRVMPTCIDLFFAFPWNNFLHYVIYDMLHQVFNGRMDKGYNCHLAISVFKDGKLTDKMVQAQKENDEECAKPKGMRRGYMGHLTFIADEIIKLFEGYPEVIVNAIKDHIDLKAWNDYCDNELRETKERDRLPLAGPRPNDGLDGGATDEDEEDEPLEGGATNQYARYITQHGGAEGDLDEDEDEETENWITGRDDFDRDYSYGGAFGLGNSNDRLSGHRMGDTRDELDDDEEYNSDDDEEGGRVTSDWSRGYSSFPQTSMLHRTQSHIRENEEEFDDNEFYETDRRRTDDNEDDPFGDFTSSDDQPDADWTNSFTSHFESIHITESGNKTSVEAANVSSGDTAAAEDKDAGGGGQRPIEHDYVRAVKTKEEEDEKLAKEYRPEEEQQGEI